MLDKIFFCSIKHLNNQVNVKIQEFDYLNGVNPNHELNVSLKGDNISWEKKQIEHYFEYELNKPKIFCNNYDELNKLYRNYERVFFD